MPITMDARRSFVRQATCLSVWLARRLAGRGMELRRALTTCTNAYRFTVLWDGEHHPAEAPPGWRDERWEELLDRLDRIDGRYPAGDAPAEMEAESLELFRPLMEPRLERDVAAWPAPADKPFGFFNYRADDAGWGDGKVTLHLSNPFAPASPFEDLRERARELARLLQHGRQQRRDLHTVSCASWLSSFGAFRGLFPREFAESASKPWALAYHLGWWGQMIDRTGGFHERNGMHLRTTGEFRYPCVTCACSIDLAMEHLRERFGV
jgi:hypothetical protein